MTHDEILKNIDIEIEEWKQMTVGQHVSPLKDLEVMTQEEIYNEIMSL